MRAHALLFILAVFSTCSTKKADTSSASVDSTAVDSTLATTPAPARLAFGEIAGYAVKKGADLPDSTNYFLLGNNQELDKSFSRSGKADPSGDLDFIINYVVAVACSPTRNVTTIKIEKVLTGESTLDVYLNITRGEVGKDILRPAQVFAIERREGYPVMQFFVNGRKDKALVLVESQ